jgi:hypothetical protein
MHAIIGTIFMGIMFVGAGDPEPAGMRLAVDLSDGSRVIGVPENNSIRLRTDFVELVIPLANIDLANWKPDRQTASIRFHNGDLLSGRVIPEPFQLRTLFGAATISMEHVVAFECLPADIHVSRPLFDDLILHYSFDVEPDGNAVVNAAQDKHHGEFNGAVWTREGDRGGVFSFSQSGDQITIPDHPELHVQRMTLCAWVLSLDDDKHSGYRGIVAKTTPGNWSNGFGLVCFPGKPDVHFFINYYSAETAPKPIPDQQWSHLAASYDGQKMVLYLNGQRVAEKVTTSYGGPIRYGSEPLLIGAAATGYHWIGKIDEVMLFGRVLSDREVERIYQRTR